MLTAASFLTRLHSIADPAKAQQAQRYFKTGEGEYGAGDTFIGVPMGKVFSIVKDFMAMPVAELEKLLESPIHEARTGAVSIMDKASRAKKTSPERLKELYDLYMRRHDRINNWDLVDLGCMWMVGYYLRDKPREMLYTLAKSESLWERRTGIVGTCGLIRHGQLDDTFQIAEMLLADKEDLIHKGTGWMLRFAGDKDRPRLLAFLDSHAATMPRTMLRYSIEKLSPEERKYYMGMKNEELRMKN